jgi:ATP-dependent RNA helicase DBP3
MGDKRAKTADGEAKKRKVEAEESTGEGSSAPPAPAKVHVHGGDGEELKFVRAETFRDNVDLPSKLRKKLEKQFAAPSPIQSVAWPLLLEQKDLIGIAKTGSGKTLGFAVPFLALSEAGTLAPVSASCAPRMVCMAPTRELTQQIAGVCEEFSTFKDVAKYPVVTIVGGMPKDPQRKALRAGAQIACCTPGRLADLAEEESIDLSHVQFLVLDEADRMLDMGFIDTIRAICGRMPKTRQTALFSATWPDSVQMFARSLVRKGKNLVQVTVGELDGGGGGAASLKANEAITQVVHVVQRKEEKMDMLWPLLKKSTARKTVIFALYKKECSWLFSTLQSAGYNVGCLNGDMSQDARNKAIENFKNDKIPMLVATDVAGRGLDVQDVELVVNYTFPLTVEDYVHRIGRTGRAGKTGKAVTYFCPNDIEKALAADLVTILENAKQTAPDELRKIADGAGGAKASKKKAHSLYGNHFKDAATMAKLEAQKVHVTFADSDDE